MPVDAARLLQRFNLDVDSLLTVGASNAKIAKGAKIAHSIILHHLPARSVAAAMAGEERGSTAPRSRIPGLLEIARANDIEREILRHNGCPWASKGCQDGCLAWAGHGGISTTVAAARARRTMAFIYSPHLYAVAILWAIAREYKRATKKGQPLAVRLRGTDDLPWHEISFSLTPAEAATLKKRFGLQVALRADTVGETIPQLLRGVENVHMYEYSKAPVRGSLGLLAQRNAGIDVTASLAADRPGGAAAAIEAVKAGFRIAIPIAIPKGEPIPSVIRLAGSVSLPIMDPQDPRFGTVVDRPVRLLCLDGDETDLRFLDPQGPQEGGFDGVAVILRTKRSNGRGADAAAFSLQPTMGQWQALKGGGFAQLLP